MRPEVRIRVVVIRSGQASFRPVLISRIERLIDPDDLSAVLASAAEDFYLSIVFFIVPYAENTIFAQPRELTRQT